VSAGSPAAGRFSRGQRGNFVMTHQIALTLRRTRSSFLWTMMSAGRTFCKKAEAKIAVWEKKTGAYHVSTFRTAQSFLSFLCLIANHFSRKSKHVLVFSFPPSTGKKICRERGPHEHAGEEEEYMWCQTNSHAAICEATDKQGQKSECKSHHDARRAKLDARAERERLDSVQASGATGAAPIPAQRPKEDTERMIACMLQLPQIQSVDRNGLGLLMHTNKTKFSHTPAQAKEAALRECLTTFQKRNPPAFDAQAARETWADTYGDCVRRANEGDDEFWLRLQAAGRAWFADHASSPSSSYLSCRFFH
jgi:hypothetical protein